LNFFNISICALLFAYLFCVYANELNAQFCGAHIFFLWIIVFPSIFSLQIETQISFAKMRHFLQQRMPRITRNASAKANSSELPTTCNNTQTMNMDVNENVGAFEFFFYFTTSLFRQPECRKRRKSSRQNRLHGSS